MMNYEFSRRFTPASINTRAIRSTCESKSGWLLAIEEEEKKVKQQKEKATHLQKFQNSVRRRAAAIQQMKNLKELEFSMKELDVAQDVMRNCINTELLLPLQNSERNSQHEQFIPGSDNADVTLQKSKNQNQSNNSITNKLTTDSSEVNLRKTDKSVTSIDEMNVFGKISFPLDCKKTVKNVNSDIDARVSTVLSRQNMKRKEKKQQIMQRTLARKMFMEMDREKVKRIQQRNNLAAEMFISFYENLQRTELIDQPSCQPKTPPQTIEQEIDDWLKKHSKTYGIVSFPERHMYHLQMKLRKKCQQLSIKIPAFCLCDNNSKDLAWIYC